MENFSLRHVIPGREALTAEQGGLLFTVDELSSSFTLVKEAVRIKSRKQFAFSLGEQVRFEDSSEYTPFIQRLPGILPEPDDHGTVLSFAKMAANSYVARTMEGWRNSSDYSDDDGFGWNSTGLRGHVFTNDKKTIVVISFKGTSTILHGGETVARDKYMDNVMFSCCCARVDISWTPVCGCYAGSTGGRSICDGRCLEDTFRTDEDSYYREALAVTTLVIAKYPRAQVWFTGHSLGGAIAALMAVVVRNTAAITFSSPGSYLYARHMGLDKDVEGSQWRYPVWNFGLKSDPIFTGECTGLVTSCYLSGYAIETACRHGMDCLFPVKSWQPDVSTHRIDWFIDNVLTRPEDYPLPTCLPNRNCTDCPKWVYMY